MAIYTITTDTYVDESASTTSYGTQTYVDVGDRPGFTRERQSYFYTDLSSLTSPVTDAKLWVYVDSFNEWSTHNVNARRLTSSFSDSSTWNTRPSNTTTNQTSKSIANTLTGWVSFDVTDIVNDIIGGETNYGIGLFDGGGGSSSNNESFRMESTENASGNDPYIETPGGGAVTRPTLLTLGVG